MQVCRALLGEVGAGLAALLFAVHPVHTEAVTGVVGRAELLASLFFLWAVMQHGRLVQSHSCSPAQAWPRLLLLAATTAAAMLSKEQVQSPQSAHPPHSTVQGITVVGVCAVRELLLVRQLAGAAVLGWGKAGLPDWARAALTRLACLVCIGLALLLARLRVMGSQLPVFTRFDNPAAVADWPARPLTQNFLLR